MSGLMEFDAVMLQNGDIESVTNTATRVLVSFAAVFVFVELLKLIIFAAKYQTSEL